MSLFDSASLVVTPNGVKEGKLYSIKPTDGSGDLSVTRATSATRVNSAGLVEVVPYNLFNYSQEFNNAAWNNTSGVTITANSAIAPNGTMTADRFVGTGGSWYFAQQKTLTSGITHTISVYVKSNTGSNQTFRLFGSTLLVSSNLTATTEWQRFEFSFTSTTALDHGIARDSSNNNADLLVWGAQLVEGSSAKDYYPTTTRLNIPRLDYTNGSCPSILVEPQRTNALLQSENLATSWTSFRSVVTTNVTTAPSGISTADKIAQQSATTDAGGVYQTISLTSGTTYTYSYYAKAGGYNWTFARVIDGVNNYYVWFNLSTGVVGTISGSATAKIESVGNGWYRCSVTFTSAGTGNQVVSYVGNSDNSDQIPSSDGVKGIYVWGQQLEAGSYATSYIPTVAASVTRNADVISKTGISSLIGQTEGTIFCDVINSKTILDTIIISLSDGTFSNYLQLSTNSSTGNLQSVIFTGGGATALGTITTNVNQRYKIAIAYKLNDYALYINGVQIGTLNSKAAPTLLTRLDISGLSWAAEGYIYSNPYNSAALFKTRLTNAELAQLTTI